MKRIVIAILVCQGLVSSGHGASVDGVDDYLSSEGEGPAIVFVHGWTCDTTVWSEQIEAFKGDYQAVALDLPGHGQSGAPADEVFSVDLYTGAIESVIAELELGRVILVGHSMGVPVIAHYAARYPDRVAALIAVDGPILPPSPPPEGAPSGPPAQNGISREESVRFFFVPQTPENVQAKVLGMMLAPSDERAAAILAPFYDPSFTFAEPPDVPILNVIAGNQPPLDPNAAQSNRPNMRSVQLEGTGHFLMMERPVEFNALVGEFLQSLEL